MAVFCSILFKINVAQNMPKLAKNVQIRRKVSKYVASVRQWRTPAGGVIGDRSAAAGCLVMVYTVYKGVGLGMGNVVRDFHDAPQTVTDDIMRYRSITLNCRHFDDT